MFKLLKIKIYYVKHISTKINHLAYKNKNNKIEIYCFQKQEIQAFPS